jgi:hypothetical protein
MRKISLSWIFRKWSFYVFTILSLILLFSFQNCGKVKFQTSRDSKVANKSCGSIKMTPAAGLQEDDAVSFEVMSAATITISNIHWDFSKSVTPLFTSTLNPVIHTFNGAGEGPGSYEANVSFLKSDGDSCILTQSFQILSGDVCQNPTGISGPSTGLVGEETSDFAVNFEECFNGSVGWDMNGDGTIEYTAPDANHPSVNTPVSFIYPTAGIYTVSAHISNSETESQETLTHQIVISNKSCVNPFTNAVVPHGQSVEFAKPNPACGSNPCLKINRTCNNGVFGGDASYTQNPASCAASAACPIYSCQGTTPANATLCAGDDTGLTVNTNKVVATSCTAAKCEYTCNSNFTKDANGVCAPVLTYSWIVPTTWGACQGACGTTGTQIRDVTCKRSDGAIVADSFCVTNVGPIPAESQSCSTSPCPVYSCQGTVPSFATLCAGDDTGLTVNTNRVVATSCTAAKCEYTCINGYAKDANGLCAPVLTYSWVVPTTWGACQGACGTTGTQTRDVTCKRSDGAIVADSFCVTNVGPIPAESQNCATPACGPETCAWEQTSDTTYTPDPSCQGFIGSGPIRPPITCTSSNKGQHYEWAGCKNDSMVEAGFDCSCVPTSTATATTCAPCGNDNGWVRNDSCQSWSPTGICSLCIEQKTGCSRTGMGPQLPPASQGF